MQVLVVANRKGGAGKTTLATHLAVEAGRAGLIVGVLDADPQGGLARWWNARAADTPAFFALQGGIARTLEGLKDQKLDLLVIDTPPFDTAEVDQIIAQADLVVIPTRATPDDISSVSSTITSADRSKRRRVFVLNSIKPNTRPTAEAALLLSEFGPVCQVVLSDRIPYGTAKTDGRTAPELKGQEKAAEEVAGVWRFVARHLRGKA